MSFSADAYAWVARVIGAATCSLEIGRDVDSLLNMYLPQPAYYKPWQHFGLDTIAPDEMRRRVDAYLERVMMRT